MKKNRILAIFFAIILAFSTLSITAFATEAQTTAVTEKSSTRHVLGSEVNIVFRDYIYDEEELPNADTVTKFKLYSAIQKSNHEDDLPERILLDLKNYPTELITEEDLFMYLETIEKFNIEEITISFSDSIWIAIVIILFLIWIFSPSSYNDSLKEIARAIKNSRS